MLDSLRKRSNSLVSTFLVLIVAVVMAFWGIDKMNNDDDNRGAPAAWVNGEAITQRDFFIEYQQKIDDIQKMRGGQLDDRLLMQLQVPQRTLDELVHLKLLAQQADKLGVTIADEELASFIRGLPMYQKKGKFDPELYAKLPNKGLEQKRYRERLAYSKLQRYLINRVHLTPADLRRNFDVKDTKVELTFAKIDFGMLAEQQKPTSTQLAEHAKVTPEKDLQAYYDSHRKNFTLPAEVELSQIRVGVPFQASEKAKADAVAKVDEVRKQLATQGFEAVARKYSDDEYAKKGGYVGWVKKGSGEPAVEGAIQKLKDKEVSEPVLTPAGFMIVRVLNRKEEKLKPFTEVKNEVLSLSYMDAFKKKFSQEKRTEWEKLLSEGKPIENELKKLKVEIKKTGVFSLAQGYIPQIGSAESMVDAIFELTTKQPVAKRLFPYQESYYFLKLEKVEFPKESEFASRQEVIDRGTSVALQTEFMMRWINTLQKNSRVSIELKM